MMNGKIIKLFECPHCHMGVKGMPVICPNCNKYCGRPGSSVGKSRLHTLPIKNHWCKDNNIPIIRIPYTHLDNLELSDLLLETSPFRLEE